MFERVYPVVDRLPRDVQAGEIGEPMVAGGFVCERSIVALLDQCISTEAVGTIPGSDVPDTSSVQVETDPAVGVFHRRRSKRARPWHRASGAVSMEKSTAHDEPRYRRT